MLYFFVNIIMYFFSSILFNYYFKDKMNYLSLFLIIFEINMSFIFIYKDINVIYFFLFNCFFVLIYKIFSSSKMSEEIILIKDGNINFHELVSKYSYYKLINYLRIRHIKLEEREYCIKKGDRLIIIKNKNNYSFPISIILNGQLQEENLFMIKKNKKWLQEELLKRNLFIKKIDYAYYRRNKIYFIKEN